MGSEIGNRINGHSIKEQVRKGGLPPLVAERLLRRRAGVNRPSSLLVLPLSQFLTVFASVNAFATRLRSEPIFFSSIQTVVSQCGRSRVKTTSLSEIAIVYAGPKLNDKGQPIEYQRSRTATPEIDEGPDKPKATRPKP